MALLIDTTVFITLERRGLPLDALPSAGKGAAHEHVAIAAITASELLMGVHRAARGQQRTRRESFVEAILAKVPVLPFDLDAARIHARLAAQMDKTGSRIGAHDLLIAATAVTYHYAVLTGNPKEFARVPGLLVKSLQ